MPALHGFIGYLTWLCSLDIITFISREDNVSYSLNQRTITIVKDGVLEENREYGCIQWMISQMRLGSALLMEVSIT